MVDLVGGRTPLRRSGARYVGRCPFHDERTPSFSVDPVKKVYYCFGCQRGGDHIAFVRETENLDFAAAVETLADRYGVRLEYEQSSPGRGAPPGRAGPAPAAPGGRGRLLLALPVGVGRGRARPRLPGRARHRRGDRRATSGSGSRPSAWDRVCAAALAKGFTRGGARAGRALGTRPARAGRPLPRPADVPAGRRPRPRARLRRPPDARRRAAEVPELARGPALPQVRGRSTGSTARASAIATAGRAIVVEGYTDVLALHQAGTAERGGLDGHGAHRRPGDAS